MSRLSHVQLDRRHVIRSASIQLRHLLSRKKASAGSHHSGPRLLL